MKTKNKRKPVSRALEELTANLDSVARVNEWADLMGYQNFRLFSRHFLRHFKIRPEPVLVKERLKSIVQQIHTVDIPFLEIAWMHSLPDEKALYSFIKRHLDCSPTQIKSLSRNELQALMGNSKSKNGE